MLKIILNLLLSFVVQQSYAAQSGLCNEMAEFACAPGTFDDGTGTNTNVKPVRKEQLIEAELPNIQNRFKSIVSDPKNAHFRSMSLSALGLNNSPYCASQKKESLAKCDNDLVEGLSLLASKKLGAEEQELPEPVNVSENGRLRNLITVISHHQFESVMTEVTDRITTATFRPEAEKKVKEKIFPQIQTLLVKKIEKMDIDPKIKKQMMDKISGVSFEGTNCTEKGSDLDHNFVPNAFYSPRRNIFKVCKGYLLSTDSDFKLATTIAHELTHAIDPCHVPNAEGIEEQREATTVAELDQQYPIRGLLQCLRTDKSVNALSAEDLPAQPSFGPMGQQGLGMAGNYGNMMGFQYGSYGIPMGVGFGGQPPTEKKYSHCKNDQIGESVSDWFAAEVVGEYIDANYKLTEEQWQIGVSNMRRDVCSFKNNQDPSSGTIKPHPVTADRIDRILLQNPKLRKKMGCSKPHPTYVYCDPEKPDQMLKLAADEAALKTKQPQFESSPDFVGPPSPAPYPATQTQPGSTR